MKKNEIFTFIAPNGVEITAVVVKELSYRVIAGEATTQYLCYSQNRLFTYEKVEDVWHTERPVNYKYGKVIVDYALLPDYDELLQLHSSMEYPQWEQNLEAEIQGINDR